MGGIGSLGWGDLVNYDWTANGTYDHVAVVTDSVNDLVSAYTVDCCGWPWQLYDYDANHLFTWINGTYCV